MEMDMQEPGEMCCGCEEDHDLAITETRLQTKTKLHPTVSPIIISCRCINYSAQMLLHAFALPLFFLPPNCMTLKDKRSAVDRPYLAFEIR